MCGIFGYVGRRADAGELVLAGLKKLEYRGYDSWGIACFNGRKLEVRKAVGKIGEVVAEFSPSSLGFGQTRWATHGGVTRANAHPHFDCFKEIAVVHNGIVENYQEIKKGLQPKHAFRSQTDTEVIVHLIEKNVRQGMSFIEAVRRAFLGLAGLNAMVALDVNSSQLVAIKNGSPLVVGLGQGENFVASDSSGLSDYVRKVIYLDDDELLSIKIDGVSLYDCRTGRSKSFRVQRIKGPVPDESLGQFKHFLIKEIFEQPRVVRRIVAESGPEVSVLANLIRKSFGTYLVGCGTASYACLAGTYFFSALSKTHVNFSVGSEFNYLEDFITRRSLVVGVSQSGETADIIESLNRAKKKGARLACLVNVIGSTLYRLSDFKVLIGAGQERAVISTKAFTGQVALLLYTAYALGGKLTEGRRRLNEVITGLNFVLSSRSQRRIRNLARRLYRHPHIYVIGRGVSFAAALESALKIKEGSYIHAEGFAAGELKHGVIALIEKRTPCIVMAPPDETQGSVLAGAMEVKARGGFIIGFSNKNNEIFDYFIEVPEAGLGSIIINVVVSQMLSYQLTLLRKHDPDKPRNLAKSVTVR